jgi:toxin-antitoxin system PIN domain toxin
VIAVDTNILVYAHRRDSEFFSAAAQVVRSLAEGGEHWAIPWPCIHEFLAIVTHPRIFQPPSSVEKAIGQVDIWVESPTLRLIGEPGNYWPALREVLRQGRIAGPKVHDARIAAICRTNGVRELWSADRDFSRIQGARVRNPLVGKP